MNEQAALLNIEYPVFGNAGARVESCFGCEVERKSRVGDFNDEMNVGGSGIVGDEGLEFTVDDDYFGHWLAMGAKLKNPPKIFHVNWFRKGADGKFLWPGYGENVRVLKWMLDRIEGRAAATETPIGNVPTPSSLTLDGLSISRDTLNELLSVDSSDWLAEDRAVGEFFAKFGSHIPPAVTQEQKALAGRLTRATVSAK